MARYIDIDKLSEMIYAKADTVLRGKEAFLYIAKWLELLSPVDIADNRAEAITEFAERLKKQVGNITVDQDEFNYCVDELAAKMLEALNDTL